MRQDNALGIPADHGQNRCTQLRPLLCKSNAHVARHAAVRILRAGPSRQPARQEPVEFPALEILDTRIERVDAVTKSTRKIFDTVADNAANAGIVLGGRPIRPMDADLRWIGALCFRNGQLEETGLAAGVLNHPATSVAWLANKIAPNGLALEAGQVVLAGSFIRPIETRKGDTIQADYGPYGSVSCYFA